MLTTTRASALPLLMLSIAAIAASGGRTADQTAPPVTLHLIAVGDVPTIRVTELAAHFQRNIPDARRLELLAHAKHARQRHHAWTSWLVNQSRGRFRPPACR